ncbi:type 1 phosphatidylinositol 4,5-bisphosphate 4-phosphatase-like [Temnothorax americanus]|uniref:type 1 phosphatidylinositol 4,5-bisphosphate 4-phosphatase-like n=1 Tax=Temnothorax americanus TaxID=1964332 RepID=UPI00406870A3
MEAPPIRNAPPGIKYHSVLDMCKVRCAHCNDTFLLNALHNSLVRCPHCHKISSVGSYARKRGIVFIIVGIIALVVGLAVTVGTYKLAETNGGGHYILYAGGFITGLLCLGRSIYYCTMKISLIENPCSLPNSSEQPVI